MLEIKYLYGGYGDKDILKNINISIEKGSFCGLIGRNGAGKSALLKTICSLLKPSKGQIFIDGQNTADFSKKNLAKKIAFMPQTLETSFDFTVKEFLTFARFPYMGVFKIPSQKDHEAIDKILDFLDLKHFAQKSINELSGGERQKVSIAQIIAQDADILIFDEPTAHLDIGAQYAILQILKNLNEELGKTIIASLHDLNSAGEFCKELILLDDGQIKKHGSVEEVLNYKDIEEAYQTRVIVKTNPIFNKPYVIPTL